MGGAGAGGEGRGLGAGGGTVHCFINIFLLTFYSTNSGGGGDTN